MRSLVFEGRTWGAYEALRQKDERLRASLRAIVKRMLRADPARPRERRRGSASTNHYRVG
jgi:hypothetical protein